MKLSGHFEWAGWNWRENGIEMDFLFTYLNGQFIPGD